MFAHDDLRAEVLAQPAQQLDRVGVPVVPDRAEVVLVVFEVHLVAELVGELSPQRVEVVPEPPLVRPWLEHAVDQDLAAIAVVYPGFRVVIEGDVLILENSPPPILAPEVMRVRIGETQPYCGRPWPSR